MNYLIRFIFFSILLSPILVFANDNCDIDNALAEVNRLFNLNEPEEAVDFVEKIISDCSFSPISIAKLKNERGNILRNLGRLDEAEKDHLQALEIAKSEPEKYPLLIGNFLQAISSIYGSRGEFDKAISYLEESIIILERTDPDYEYLTYAYTKMGINHSYKGDYETSNKYYDLAIDHSKRIQGDESEEYAIALNSKGANVANQGKIELAEEYHRKALAIFELDLLSQQRNIAITSSNLAMILTKQGKYDEAEIFFKNAIEIQKSLQPGDSMGLVIYMYNLGFNYRFQYKLLDSYPLIMEAAEMVERVLPPMHPSIGVTKAGVAQIYKEQGRYEESIELYKQIHEIFKAGLDPDSNRLAALYKSLAWVATYEKKPDDSEKYLREALRIISKNNGDDSIETSNALSDFALFLDTEERYEEAQEYHLNSLEILLKRANQNITQIAFRLNQISKHYLNRNINNKALDYSNRALKIMLDNPEMEFGELKADILSALASSYYSSGDLNKTLEYADQSNLSFAHYLRTSDIKDNNLLMDQLYRQKNHYVDHIKWLSETLNNDQDLYITDKSFQVAQLASISPAAFAISRANLRNKATNEDSIIRKYQDLMEERNLLQKRLDNYLLQSESTEKEKEVRTMRKQKKSMDLLIDRMSKQIEIQMPESFSSSILPKSIPIKEVQKRIKGRNILIKFLVAKEEVFVWAITNNDQFFYKVNFPNQTLNDHLHKIRDHILKIDYSFDSYPFDEAFELFNKLLKPSLTRFGLSKELIIIPDGILNLLNFNSLINNQFEYTNNRNIPWLIKSSSISIMPSISSLFINNQDENYKRFSSFLGIGDPLLMGSQELSSLNFRNGGINQTEISKLAPLPETTREINTIASLFDSNKSKTLLGKEATDKLFLSVDLDKYDLISFATHAVLAKLEDNTIEPSLVLSGLNSQNTNDWLLTASEIRKIRINANLVILSACDTASMGSNGENAYTGLAESFFYAGAKSLLVSQWPVESYATVELSTNMMSEFTLNQDITKAEALRRSMIAMVNDTNETYHHPFYWAPFVLVGAN